LGVASVVPTGTFGDEGPGLGNNLDAGRSSSAAPEPASLVAAVIGIVLAISPKIRFARRNAI
jgi:hypothetical protein